MNVRPNRIFLHEPKIHERVAPLDLPAVPDSDSFPMRRLTNLFFAAINFQASLEESRVESRVERTRPIGILTDCLWLSCLLHSLFESTNSFRIFAMCVVMPSLYSFVALEHCPTKKSGRWREPPLEAGPDLVISSTEARAIPPTGSLP